MKKCLFISVAILVFVGITAIFANLSAAREQKNAMAGVIRLHVRAENDTKEEQELKLEVRNEILRCTENLLRDCTTSSEAKQTLSENLLQLEKTGQEAVYRTGASHKVSVSFKREIFEYRAYDGFFLPEGEYDSLIVTIGSGEGKNWWCVVFPAACYMGAADTIETNATRMPACFRLARKRAEPITVKFRILEKIKAVFR